MISEDRLQNEYEEFRDWYLDNLSGNYIIGVSEAMEEVSFKSWLAARGCHPTRSELQNFLSQKR